MASVGTPSGRLVEPVVGALATLGRLIELTGWGLGHLVRDVCTGRHPWRESLNQTIFFAGVAGVPAVLVAIPFGVILSVQVGSLTSQLGASSLAGSAGALGILQQGAPIGSALLIGGAVGSAIAADLGARTVRDEIDAMRTMGIDPMRRVVAPRLLAVLLIAPLICVLIIFVGVASGYVINVSFQGGAPGSYLGGFGQFAGVGDLIIALGKSILFGVVVVAIACQRGLEARGGPRGVADAVNAAVVLGVVASFMLNLVVTQLVTMFLPQAVG
ncbi:ABC transporter permease [Williamsia sp. CHRR-6]|uniref:MlaE family ABC transporter permease n=1 Tax=Williamsia sp. CHRR-6 TaxID=2835871 RepID=UPI001BDB18EC|nr:ABC transporter permease [Williamsia sp. CHRR-6]MBT0566570.1 ABC transporter permease [Williamsia sp. CHRR-6]